MADVPRRFARAMITGITGSGGSYLAEHILAHAPGTDVHGIARWHSTATPRNLAAVADRIRLHECDLTDLSSVVRALTTAKPDVVFHVASHANVRESFTTPLAVIQNNVMGTANLLEGIRLAGLDPVVQICSTSEVYGQVDPKNVPINEGCPLNPSSPYAVSKVAQDQLGYTYFRSYGMKVIRTRMFAYLNPRRRDLFATSFAFQVAEIEAGKRAELLHGNLESVRTIIDVRDCMTAYWTAVERATFGEAYNIGGTTVISVGEFLELLKKHARRPIPSRQDPALVRPADVTLQIPNSEKFIRATGWGPKHSFEESVAHLLDHARRVVAAGG
ncbi:MAG: SDR family oxidoreductase [Rhodospirillales bacterium]|nr:SDR family oxidoreductase [Rhodospirillales bacterium]